MITVLLIFSALLIFKLWWDKRAKDSGRIINHSLSGLIDVVLYAISIYFFSRLNYIGMVGLLIIVCDLRWILFDIGYNVINNRKWNHVGNSAWLDRLLDKIDGEKDNIAIYGWLFKLVFLLIGVIIIVTTHV